MLKDKDLQKIRISAAFSTSILSFLILIPIINSIHVPLSRNKAGIISLANITNTSPYTNYIKFIILFLVPLFLGIIALNIGKKQLNKYWRILIFIRNQLLPSLNNLKLYSGLIFTLIILWAVNKNYDRLDWILIDTFHEGEYLGFLPNFLFLKSPFLNSFMIHGFGLDVLPSLIARQLHNYSNTIAVTRLLRMTQGLIGYLGCYWIIWEIVSSINSTKPLKQNIFFFSTILFTLLDGTLFKFFTGVFAGRDTLFLLQLALTIRLIRLISINNTNRTEKLILPVLIGASIPISFLYVYDRAAYFLLIYILVCSLLACFERRFFYIFFLNSTFGLSISLILETLVLGLDQISEVLSQILFWARYGRYISFNPLPSFNTETQQIWFYFGFATLTQIFTIIYLVSDYKKYLSLSTFLKKRYLFIVLLFASLVYMRISLDSPDNSDYVGSSSLISVFLAIYLGLSLLKTYFENKLSWPGIELLPTPVPVFLIMLIVLLNTAVNPLLSLDKLRRVYVTYRTPDAEVARPFLLALNAVRPEVSQSSCFFTLTQEGIWYYLLNKPSCSKFSIIFYARTTNAQKTVIREVETTKPSIVLFSSTTRVSTFDGISTADAVPIIYRYFLNHYRPYVLAESQWFWKRSDKQITFKQSKYPTEFGNIDTVLGTKIFQGVPALLNGVAFSNQQKPAEAIYISYGEDNQLIEVAKVGDNGKWRASLPTISLPLGQGVIKVWSYVAEGNQLVQIGKDIKIDLIKPFSS